MSERRARIYWDACVFLDYVNGVPEKVPVLNRLLDRASSGGNIELFTSTLSITEVAFGRLDQTGTGFDLSVEQHIDALWTDPTIKQAEYHRFTAFEARDLMRASKLAGVRLAGSDAIHLATARRLDVAEFHTYDRKLFQHAQQLGFPIREPWTA